MFTKQSRKGRFNLLVLSDNEHYFTDYSCVYYPEARTEEESHKRQVKGRLKVCSKSIIFEPVDLSLPLVKYEFTSIIAIQPITNSLISLMDSTDIFQVTTNMTVEVKENNVIAPYVFKKTKSIHRFAVKYVAQTAFLAEVGRLLSIAKLPSYEAEEKIKQIVMDRESSVVFDMTWLETLDERALLETFSVRVTPLVVNAGRFMITDRMVYFQPFNNVDPNPVEKFALKDIVRVIKRRHALRHVGIEFFINSGDDTTSAFFAFKSQDHRDKVYDMLTTQPGMTKLEHENQLQTMLKWQSGLLSNFEYLTYLNSLADRSFNDLTQYPVFPWILSDYSSRTLDLNSPKTFRDLSKPIGALNPERLAGFLKRYRDMPDGEAKFLYGTHYSTPGYVLFYLVRKAPEYMLRLQNGKFDEPDRLFNSIQDTFSNVLINAADLKELIPEFFIDGSFLVNAEGLSLGRKQDGTRADNVVLPPWASSPADFITKHKEALESDYVSANLHNWIDLIFGYKQQGEPALQANNLFHPLTYEGAVDFERLTDAREKQAILLQINEFGQTPKRIFEHPHPKRFSREERGRIVAGTSATASGLDGNTRRSSGGVPSPSGLPSSLTGLYQSNGASSSPPQASPISTATSTSSAGNGMVFGRPPRSSTDSSSRPSLRSSTIDATGRTFGSTASPAMDLGFDWMAPTPKADPVPYRSNSPVSAAPSSPGPSRSGLTSSFGSNSTPSRTFGAALPPISSLGLDIDEPVDQQFGIWDKIHLLTASDTIRSHRDVVSSICLSSNGKTMYSVSQDSTLKMYSFADGKQLRSSSVSQLALSACLLTKDERCVLISSWDNNVYTYSIDYGRIQDTLYAHDDAVSCIAMQGDTIVTASWDSTVKVWGFRSTGIDKVPIANFANLESEVRCADINATGTMVAVGTADGAISLYDIRLKSPIRLWHTYSDQVSSVKWSPDGRVVSCSKDGHLKMQDQFGHDMMEVQLPDTLRCLATNGVKALLGGENACLRVWNLLTSEELVKIPKPSKSPINCLAISPDCEFVVTGADDGSITRWESK